MVIYSQGSLRLVAERVPPCGSELPDSGLTPEQARHLAGAADRKAGEAFKAGDLDRAFRLLTDARVLDPYRSELWDQHEQRIRQSARQGQAQKAQAVKSGPGPDSAGAGVIEQETRWWAEWNRMVGVRTPEREGAA